MDLTPSRPARGAASRANDGTAIRETFLGWLRALAQFERTAMQVRVPAWTVAGAAAMLGCYALVLYYRADLTLVQGDAVGHLYIARRAIDSVTPSFAQFGYIWLPLPHLLMLPLVWNDTMWETGLAGSIPSLIAFALSTAYVYRFALALTKSGIAGILAAALFATNPNLLFMQATPMGEAVMIFFIIAAAYHLTRWAQDGSSLQLILSAAFVFGGTLCRYEVWWLIPFGAGVVALGSLRRHGWGREIEGITITWGILASYGAVLWIIYNLVIFGDPLHFVHDVGSAQSFAQSREALGVLPSKGHPIASAQLYGWALIDVLGLPLVLAGVGGSIALVCSRLSLTVKCAVLLPATLFLFQVVSLTQAQSAMLSPHSAIPAFTNTRYGLLLLPAIVILASVLARQLRMIGIALLFVALVPQLMVLPTPSGVQSLRSDELARAAQPDYVQAWKDDNFPLLARNRPATLVEAVVQTNFSENAVDAESRWIHEHASTGKIMMSEHLHASAIMLRSHLKLSRFIYEGNEPYFQQDLRTPGRNTEWITYQANAVGDQVRPLVAGTFPPGFNLVYQDDELQIFHRQSGTRSVVRPDLVPADARLIETDTSVGEVFTDANKRQRLVALTCEGGVATVSTTIANLYAKPRCDQLPDMSDFGTDSVGLRVDRVELGTIITLTSGDGRRVQFTSADAWLELRGGERDGEEPSRPAAIPVSASRIHDNSSVGDEHETSANGRTLYGIRCTDDVATIITTREAVYTDLSCDSLPDDHAMLTLPVKLTITSNAPDATTIRIDAKGVGPITISSGRAWMLSN